MASLSSYYYITHLYGVNGIAKIRISFQNIYVIAFYIKKYVTKIRKIPFNGKYIY